MVKKYLYLPAFCLLLFLTGTASVYAQATKTTRAMDFTPHEAVYEISLTKALPSSGLADLEGTFAFEWTGDDVGWSTAQTYNLTYIYDEGPPMVIRSQFSNWEAKDGSLYVFDAKRMRNGELFEDITGQATRDEAGALNVSYKTPGALNFDVSEKNMFPNAHTEAIIESAHMGRKFMPTILFDGSDAEGPVDVSVFITPNKRQSDFVGDDIDASLLDVPSWSVRYAFFPRGQNNNEFASDYEMTMRLYKNGIVDEMLIDYKDFSMRLAIKKLRSVR